MQGPYTFARTPGCRRLSLAAAILLTAVAPGAAPSIHASAQAPAPSRPAQAEKFDEVSIKPSTLGSVSRISMPANGRFVATNVSLPMLIRFAYQVQNFQILERPRWLDATTFDIEAVGAKEPVPQPGGTPVVRARVREMLADKFKLKLRIETRDLPVYHLVTVRADKRPGPQLRQSSLDCAALAGTFARGAAGAPPPADLMQCGVRMQPGVVAGGGVRLGELALMLSRLLGRAVEDRTSLAGVYDLHLEFFHELAPPADEPLTATTSAASATADGRAEVRPSIFTALQDQLGLRLQPTRGPVEVLVITGVERPS